MSDVKRYDCTDGGSSHCYGCYTMTQDDQYGDYVTYEDFAAERAAREAAEADARRYMEDAASWMDTAAKNWQAYEALSAKLAELDVAISSQRLLRAIRPGFRVYGNEWLVQVWRSPTLAEKAAGVRDVSAYAYFAKPPTGTPDTIYPTKQAAILAAITEAIDTQGGGEHG